MKKRFSLLVALLLSLSLMLPACTGGSESKTKTDPSINPPTTDAPSTQEQHTEPPQNGETPQPGLSFDFHEAVQNIYIFGHRISLPCKFEDFGDDFSLNLDRIVPVGDTGAVTIRYCYKGEVIGIVSLKDGEGMENDVYERRHVFILSVGTWGAGLNPIDDPEWRWDPIEADIMGLSFDSTEDEVIEILGNPVSKEGSYYEGCLVYELSEFEYIYFRFSDGKMVQINIRIEEGY